MAKADSVHSTPPTDTSENSSIREGDAALIEAVKDIAVCDDALNELYKQFGDDYEDREDRKTWEERREANIAVLANRPAISIEGLRAKATAMQLATIAEDYESCGDIGQSLAQDVLGPQLVSTAERSNHYGSLEDQICDLLRAADLSATLLENTLQNNLLEDSSVYLSDQFQERLIFAAYEVEKRARALRDLMYPAEKSA